MAPGASDIARRPFHLAIPVDDLGAARQFYGSVIGCAHGRSAPDWVDWNLYGHQVVTHQVDLVTSVQHNRVDGDDVPVPHFGVILTIREFHELAERLRRAAVQFVIEPHVRFEGEIGEQWTMFLLDPSGNPLEFKAFADDAQIFAY